MGCDKSSIDFSSADESSPVGVERLIVNAKVATVPGSIQFNPPTQFNLRGGR
jgi:hypothetical protein